MEPSTWHMTLVFLGFRYDGPLPTDEDRKLIRRRRITALALIVLLTALAFLALRS